MFRYFSLISIVLLAAFASAGAQVPTTIPFQGRIVDADGAPILTGTPVQFSIFSTPTGGSALWGPETHTVIPVNGITSVFLGDGDTPDPIDAGVFSSGDRFLEVEVGGETLTPRFRMGASAYSFRAESVVADGVDAAALAANSVGSSEIQNLSVTSSDLATDAVTFSKIADNAINTNHIAPNTISADDIGAGAVASSEVLNNSLSAVDLLDEPGAAATFRNTDLNMAEGVKINILSRTINCPTAGIILAIGSASFQLPHTPFSDTEVTLSISQTSVVPNPNNQARLEIPADSVDANSVFRLPIATSGTFSVGAGNQTIFLVGSIDASAGGDTEAEDANLTLLFVPTSY